MSDFPTFEDFLNESDAVETRIDKLANDPEVQKKMGASAGKLKDAFMALFKRGYGAAETNWGAVNPNIKKLGKEAAKSAWGYARVNAFIEKTKGYKTSDKDIAEWLKGNGPKPKPMDESVNEGRYGKELTKIFGYDFPFDYTEKGSKIVIEPEGYNDDGTLFNMKDDWKEKIIKTIQKKKKKWHASPNMGGGITIYTESELYEFMVKKLDKDRDGVDWEFEINDPGDKKLYKELTKAGLEWGTLNGKLFIMGDGSTDNADPAIRILHKFGIKESVNEGKGYDEARKLIKNLREKVYRKLNDAELEEFTKEMADHLGLTESVNEKAYKGDFSIGGFGFKAAVVNRGGLDHTVTLFLKEPDYRDVKQASEELRKVEKKFFGSKYKFGGGYSQEGDQISSSTYSKKDCERFVKYLLTLNESVNEEKKKKPVVGHTVKRKEYKDDPPDIGLYSKGGRDAIKGTGYSSKEKAEFTIKKLDYLISKGERVWAMSIATTMESRAKKHQHQTDGMRDAMKIFRKWIDKNKKSK